MSTLLKDLYNPAFYDQFCRVAGNVLQGFDAAAFQSLIFDEQWEARELKGRMKHTSAILHRFLPQPFEKAAGAILDTVRALQAEGIAEKALEYMFFPDYIERFGLEHYEVAAGAMEQLTPFTSCEFAVRPFIKSYEEQMLERMLRWSGHPNHHVRRLASEGSRPRLPWAMALPGLKKDPSPILPILENFQIGTPLVTIGGQLEFSFELLNKSLRPALVRLEYGLYYLRSNGSHSRKVFKISEREYPPNSTTRINRRQSFRPITTRRYYPGPQGLSLIANGVELTKKIFNLSNHK